MLPPGATNAANHLLFRSVKGADGDPCAMAAYRTGKIVEGIDGRVHNPRRTDVAATGLALPETAPERWRGEDATQALWVEAAAQELCTNDRVAAGMGGKEACIFKRNVSIARTAIMALPADESQEVREQIVRKYSEYIAAETNCAVEWAVHAPPDKGSRNWHAHLMVSPRVVTEDGFGGRAKKWSDRKEGPKLIKDLREKFEEIVNTTVASPASKIDMRSLRARASEARKNGDEKLAEELLNRRREKLANPRKPTPEYVRAARARNGPQKRPVVSPSRYPPTLVSQRGEPEKKAKLLAAQKAPVKREVLGPRPLPKTDLDEMKTKLLAARPLPKTSLAEMKAKLLAARPLPKTDLDEMKAKLLAARPLPKTDLDKMKETLLAARPLPKTDLDEIRAKFLEAPSPSPPATAEKAVEEKSPAPKEAPRPPSPAPSPSPGM